MKSDLPKVVHTIHDKNVLWIMSKDLAKGAGATDICLVVGYQAGSEK